MGKPKGRVGVFHVNPHGFELVISGAGTAATAKWVLLHHGSHFGSIAFGLDQGIDHAGLGQQIHLHVDPLFGIHNLIKQYFLVRFGEGEQLDFGRCANYGRRCGCRRCAGWH